MTQAATAARTTAAMLSRGNCFIRSISVLTSQDRTAWIPVVACDYNVLGRRHVYFYRLTKKAANSANTSRNWRRSVLNAHPDSGVTPGRMSLRTMATGPGPQACWDRKNRTGCNELRENAIVSPKRATIDEKMESSRRSTRSPSRRSYLL